MAVVFSNNATTVLSSNITNSATSIAVQNGSVFPTLSGTDYFYATLQDPGNTKREIVKVTARSGNTLTVTRAVDGSSASAFSANDAFELRLNAAALNDAVNSGTADLELNSFTGDGSEVDFTLSMEALEANTLVYIDGVYQNKTAYSISGYVLTFSAAPDNGAAIEVTTATVAPIQESTDFLLNQFTGDGSDTTFTLSSSPEENQTTVFISGVYQSKSNYSISGTTLTFSTAPPASSSIEVMVARTVVYGIGTPSNDTVSTAKIVDGAVTPAKLSLTYATETFVGTAVSNLVDSSPAALDTLNELAAALGDDPNFATTVTNSIALKAPLASPSFTGNLTMASGGSIVAGGVNDLILNAGESGTPDIYLQSGGSTKVKIEGSNGSVGIGTSSPSKGLHLNFSNDLAAIRFQNTANAKVWDLTPSIPNVANSGFSLHNVTDNTVPLHVDNSGSVGIGTSSPSASKFSSTPDGVLNVSGNKPVVYLTEEDETDSNVWMGLSNEVGIIGNTGTALAFRTGASTATERARIDSSGNLLVGTTDTSPFDSSTEQGTVISDGQAQIAGTSTPLYLNRQASDGDIANFRKDGTTVGSIGSNAAGGTPVLDISANSSSGIMRMLTSGSERMRIDASGNVGIGSSSPTNKLGINRTSINSNERLINLYTGTTTANAYVSIGAQYSETNALSNSEIRFGNEVLNNAPSFLAFATGNTTAPTERMRIDSSGNLLVGKTSTNFNTVGIALRSADVIQVTRSGDTALEVNRKDNDGKLAEFYKDGTAIGIIGVANNNNMQIAGTVAAHAGMEFGTNIIYPMSGGSFQDAAVDLGYSSTRFKNIYRSGSTYSTSDRSMKQDIRDLTDAERNVAVACKGLLKVFRFIDTVEKDGDGANIHFGVIAQELAEAFEAEGLDANDYQLYKSTTYTDENDVEQTRLNVCYENLLAFIIAAI